MTESLTVVIPCKDDARVAACLASIDVPVDVVLAFNGSPAGFADGVMNTSAGLSGLRLHRVELVQPNISAALEAGITAARSRPAILIESDRTLRPGART